MRYKIGCCILLLSLGQPVFAGDMGIAANYLYGIPLGGIGLHDISWSGGSVDFGGEEIGIKKNGFDFGISWYYCFKNLGIEVGVQIDRNRKNEGTLIQNDTAWIRYNEDAINWNITNLDIGTRHNFLKQGLLRPYANAGITMAWSRVKYLGDEGAELDWTDKGTHFGCYAGGGLNLRIREDVAVSIPVKIHLYTKSDYTEYYNDYEISGFSVSYKPPAIFTAGLGIEYYPLAEKPRKSRIER